MQVIQCEGSFWHVGRAVGEASRGVVSGLYDLVLLFLLRYSTVGDELHVQRLANAYAESALAYWPPAIEFLQGLAEGAKVPFGKIAVIAFSEEIASEFCRDKPAKCTTCVITTSRGQIIGHNEDYEPHYLGKMILLDAGFLLKESRRCVRTVGVTYPGMLPNLAGSLNASGIAITNNSLWPPAQVGISKQVQHFRASLEPTVEKAIRILSQQPIALTTHYTIASGLPSPDAVSLEVANAATARELCVLRQIGPEPFFHANHASSLALYDPDPAVAPGGNSIARLNKLAALPRSRCPKTAEEMLAMLSENDGLLHRTPDQHPTSATLATVVIHPAAGLILVRDANPAAPVKDHRVIVSRTQPN